MFGENGDALAALLPMILILLGISIVGLIAWLVWAFTRSKGGEQTAGETPPPADRGLPPSVTQTADLFLALKRSPVEEWEIYVAGQRYRTLEAVPDPQDRVEVVSALKALAAFAQDYIQKQKGAPALAQTPRKPVPATAKPPAPPPAAEIPSLRESQARTTAGASLLPTIDFAQEIGEIVDEIMARTPDLQDHTVTLLNSPQGGLAFVVDGVTYQEISDIPQPEIQALIRQATKEWERR